jgi:hypothetical protein
MMGLLLALVLDWNVFCLYRIRRSMDASDHPHLSSICFIQLNIITMSFDSILVEADKQK